jgi:predicted ribosome quality control (RQC) complex YloA/Tae2 family protein
MKTIILELSTIPVTFYVGRSQQENHAVIDLGSPDDIWCHLEGISSCHVVAVIPPKADRRLRTTIKRQAAILCKQNTAKAASQRSVPVTCALLKHIQKDAQIAGTVRVHESTTIIV